MVGARLARDGALAVEGVPTVEVLILRLIGAIGGSVIAVAIVPPGAWLPIRRLSVSLASGMMLTPIFRHYMGWPGDPDSIIAAACIVSACGWWIWHAIIRSLEAEWFQAWLQARSNRM